MMEKSKYVTKRSFKLPLIIISILTILVFIKDYRSDGVLFNMNIAYYLNSNIVNFAVIFIVIFCSSQFTFSEDGILLSSLVKKYKYSIKWEEIDKIYLSAHKDIVLGIKKKGKKKIVRKYITSVSKTELKMILYILHINGIHIEQAWISNKNWKHEAEKLGTEGKIPKFR